MVTLVTILGALCVCAWSWFLGFTWRQRCARETPIYIWPLASHWRQEMEMAQECATLAQDVRAWKHNRVPGLQAQWDSGLGREFPLNHLN